MVSGDYFLQYQRHINSGLARLLAFMDLDSVEVEAQGVYVWDNRGRKFIDFLGGYGVFNFGHRHPKIVSAVKEQLDKMPLSSKIMLNSKQAELAEMLARLAPKGIEKFFFCNSGTEAVEGALKLARLATSKRKVLYTTNSFHGKTLGSLSASGRNRYRDPFEPLLSDFVPIPFGDASALSSAIDESTSAFIVEPIQGEGGIRVPVEGYLKEAREITRSHGVLLIVDEVQTGLGRTGKNFAVEHEGVEPDIIVLGKALGGGVLPLATFGGTEMVWRKLEDDPLLHTSTFGGNPLACAAGIAGLNVLLEENLAERAGRIGESFIRRLSSLCSNYPNIISEVRGKGLMVGIEFTSQDAGELFIACLIKAGILVAFTLNSPQVIRMEPPLNTPEEVFEEVLNATENALKSVSSFFQ